MKLAVEFVRYLDFYHQLGGLGGGELGGREHGLEGTEGRVKVLQVHAQLLRPRQVRVTEAVDVNVTSE